MITSKEYPGWGYSIVNGATTIWERWDSYTKENGIKKGMNSFNHYSMGSCTEWMYEYCLGIRPDFHRPAFQNVSFAPCFDLSGTIPSARGHYDSPYGRISIRWEKKNSDFEYVVICPNEINVTFKFDGMSVVKEEHDNDCYKFVLIKAVQ